MAMVARRALQRVPESAGVLLVRPFVVMAARALGPGPTRLRLVKLAHNLGARELSAEATELPTFVEDQATNTEPTRRAA